MTQSVPAWKVRYLPPVTVVHDPNTGETVKTDHRTGYITLGGPELLRDSVREAYGLPPKGNQ